MKPAVQIPEETFHAARRIYNPRHSYLRIGDQLGRILQAVDLELLDPQGSLGGEAALRLGMATAFQYAESLPDLAASEAALRRLDWRYALFLPANHPGVSPEALCGFRRRLYMSRAGMQEFGLLFDALAKAGLPAAAAVAAASPAADQAERAGQILLTVCEITRLHRLNLAMKMALSALSSARPDWLRTVFQPHWYERYKSGQVYQPAHQAPAGRAAEAGAVGEDIRRLMSALQQPGAGELAGLPEVRSLAQLWEEQYQNAAGSFTWRGPGCAGCKA